MRSHEFRRALKYGPYAWPGGYPMFWVTTDGAALCWACATEEKARISLATATRSHEGWAVEGYDVNWEDPELYCVNCNKSIESAYAEKE